jgi:hypothetical protein
MKGWWLKIWKPHIWSEVVSETQSVEDNNKRQWTQLLSIFPNYWLFSAVNALSLSKVDELPLSISWRYSSSAARGGFSSSSSLSSSSSPPGFFITREKNIAVRITYIVEHNIVIKEYGTETFTRKHTKKQMTTLRFRNYYVFHVP